MGLLGGLMNFASEALTGVSVTSDFHTSMALDNSEEIFEKLIQKWDEILQKKELVENFEIQKSSEILPKYFGYKNQNLEICKSTSGSFLFFGSFNRRWDDQFYISYKPSKEQELIFSYSNCCQDKREYEVRSTYHEYRHDFIVASLYLKFISGTSSLRAEKLLVRNTSWLSDFQSENLEKFCKIDEKNEFYNHLKDFFNPIINFKNAEKEEKKRLEIEAREAEKREQEKLRLQQQEQERQKEMEAQEKEKKRVSNLLKDLDSF
ncbi:MAG: hypothetical protein MJ174_02815 [Treponema sp.]|nr:hypothetical protein [Treponema sp.]